MGWKVRAGLSYCFFSSLVSNIFYVLPVVMFFCGVFEGRFVAQNCQAPELGPEGFKHDGCCLGPAKLHVEAGLRQRFLREALPLARWQEVSITQRGMLGAMRQPESVTCIRNVVITFTNGLRKHLEHGTSA